MCSKGFVPQPLVQLVVDQLNSHQLRIATNFLTKEECTCPEQSIFNHLLKTLATDRSSKEKLGVVPEPDAVSVNVSRSRRAKERKKANASR
jgi:hypothetical protein